MNNNKFSGSIPNSWARIKTLQVVYLYGNELTGMLPSPWDSKALVQLQVANNKLSGPLPAWPAPNLVIYRIGSYTNHICSGNQLSGQVPPDLPKLMPRLKQLHLPCNNLSGTLPADLGGLVDLTRLVVSGNSGIHGTLPPSLGKLTKLTILDISDTSIAGTVPDSFSALTSLTDLRLHRTKLSGCIPTSMASMSVLDSLPGWKRSSNITGFCY